MTAGWNCGCVVHIGLFLTTSQHAHPASLLVEGGDALFLCKPKNALPFTDLNMYLPLDQCQPLGTGRGTCKGHAADTQGQKEGAVRAKIAVVFVVVSSVFLPLFPNTALAVYD